MSTAPTWPGDRGGHEWPKDREVESTDGVRVRYTIVGDTGPWVALCAGFMCPDNFWRYLVPLLADRYRLLVLNYRGIGASTDPRPPGFHGTNLRTADYTVAKFAADVGAVLAAEDATDVTILGHSMGCQVALETWRQHRDRTAAIVLVTGAHASPLHTFYGSKLGLYLFPFASFGLPLLPRAAQWGIVRSLRLPIAMPVARLIKALGADAPPEAMTGYFEHFGQVDPMVALRIARGMHAFDASGWLHDVDVPLLVVVGSEDRFTPPELGDEIIRHVPDSELVTVRGGTHGALIEYPEEIADAVADFLHRRLGHDPVPRAGDPARLEGPVRA